MSTNTTAGGNGQKIAVLALAVIAGASLVLFINAGSIPAPGKMPNQIGPGLWPRYLLGILAVLCCVKIIQLLKSSVQKKEAETATRLDALPEADRDRRVLIAAALMVFGLVFAIHFFGFLISTLLFLLAFTYLGKWRKIKLLTVIALFGSVAINYLFLKIIYIPLPKGQYFFEDITVMVYRALGIF